MYKIFYLLILGLFSFHTFSMQNNNEFFKNAGRNSPTPKKEYSPRSGMKEYYKKQNEINNKTNKNE